MDYNLLVIAHTNDNKYLGRCGFYKFNNQAELAIVLTADARRRKMGVAVIPFLAKLAQQQNLTPFAVVDPLNIGGVKLMERINWHYSGIHEANGYQNGHHRYKPVIDRCL